MRYLEGRRPERTTGVAKSIAGGDDCRIARYVVSLLLLPLNTNRNAP